MCSWYHVSTRYTLLRIGADVYRVFSCAALPLVNSAGTSVACTTASDRDSRIAATGATSGSGSSGAVSSCWSSR